MKGPPVGRLGKVRSSQLITTFGPGAIVDLPDRDSYMVLGLHAWPPGNQIDEPNLRSVLGVQSLRATALTKERRDVPVRRFPIVHRCPSCSRLIRGSFCQRRDCNVGAAPARFVVACPNGHVDDFPWHWWAHSLEKGPSVATTANGETPSTPIDECSEEDGALVLDDRGASNTLSELYVKCLKCRSSRSLRGALQPGSFRKFSCSGLRFWLDDAEDDCDGAVRGVLRGASNVYFSVTASALSLPRHSSPVSVLLRDHWATLLQASETTRKAFLTDILVPKGYSVEEGLAAIDSYVQVVKTEDELRQEEYHALCGPHATGDVGPPAPYFQARDGTVPPKFSSLIRSVALVDRLREVRAVRGLTRLEARDQEAMEEDSVPVAPITRGKPEWLPAVENFGEGIFLRLNPEVLGPLEANADLTARAGAIGKAYAIWREQRGLRPAKNLPSVALVALHSLAHLLIRHLSLYCGYGMASIRERVYGVEGQAGILIYTAAADADGSLGGLVSFGTPERLGAILDAGVAHAAWCSQDPLCRDRQPHAGEHLSGAACHACLLLPETSCEHGNKFLDRGMLRSDQGSALLDAL
jgi:hypothetical protein